MRDMELHQRAAEVAARVTRDTPYPVADLYWTARRAGGDSVEETERRVRALAEYAAAMNRSVALIPAPSAMADYLMRSVEP